MWFKKLSDTQKKEWKINHKKMNEADNERAVKYPHLRKKSYSATHKPYDRTSYGDLSPRGREWSE